MNRFELTDLDVAYKDFALLSCFLNDSQSIGYHMRFQSIPSRFPLWPFGSPQCTYNGVARDNLCSINSLSIVYQSLANLFYPNAEQKRHHKNISRPLRSPILADCLTAGIAEDGRSRCRPSILGNGTTLQPDCSRVSYVSPRLSITPIPELYSFV